MPVQSNTHDDIADQLRPYLADIITNNHHRIQLFQLIIKYLKQYDESDQLNVTPFFASYHRDVILTLRTLETALFERELPDYETSIHDLAAELREQLYQMMTSVENPTEHITSDDLIGITQSAIDNDCQDITTGWYFEYNNMITEWQHTVLMNLHIRGDKHANK